MNARQGPNWMLYAFIGVSLLIHVWLFYQARERMIKPRATAIEVEIPEGSPPPARTIPQPPPETKQRKSPIEPDIQPEPLTPRETMMPAVPPPRDRVPETAPPVAPPEPITAPSVAEWKGPSRPDPVEGGSRPDYFNRIRLSIERHKQYPFSARQRHLEGKVILSFTIDAEGRISALSMVEGARFPVLNEAAVAAVRAAAPFESPPEDLFDPPIKVEVPILFELQR